MIASVCPVLSCSVSVHVCVWVCVCRCIRVYVSPSAIRMSAKKPRRVCTAVSLCLCVFACMFVYVYEFCGLPSASRRFWAMHTGPFTTLREHAKPFRDDIVSIIQSCTVLCVCRCMCPCLRMHPCMCVYACMCPTQRQSQV